MIALVGSYPEETITLNKNPAQQCLRHLFKSSNLLKTQRAFNKQMANQMVLSPQHELQFPNQSEQTTGNVNKHSEKTQKAGDDGEG